MLKGFVSGEEKDIVRIPMKTRNLFDGGDVTVNLGNRYKTTPIALPAGLYTLSYDYSSQNTSSNTIIFYHKNAIIQSFNVDGSGRRTCVIDSNQSITDIRFYSASGYNQSASYTADFTRIMLNSGSTALPYEPYGYQEGWEVRDSQDRLIWGREDELQTATGTLPFKGYSLPVKVKSLLGNAVQNGTPAPDNIVMPEMCGVRTGNLWDEDYTGISATIAYVPIYVGSGDFTLSTTTPFVPLSVANVFLLSGNVSSGASTYSNGAWSGQDRTVSSDNGYITIAFRHYQGSPNPADYQTMLNSGSTALPYEPFGWAEKITCAGQTVPVYLGQTQTVRKIGKLVLTGKENWSNVGGQAPFQYLPSNFGMLSQDVAFFICSHYKAIAYNDSWTSNDKFVSASAQGLRFKDSSFNQSLDDFKSYLASEYAAGHPVTVWYVLANEQIGIVNEPLCKISTYADELSSTVATLPEIPTTTGQNTLTVDSNLAPSKLEVSVHAKKIHYGFKIDKSNDDSESAVIYTHDAVTMTPAHMDFTNDRFDYGSWGNAFFVRDCYPVALNLDGTIAYRLDPDDYTKKMDGTPSDIFYELLATEPSDWSTQWKQYYTKSGDEYVLNSQSSAPTFAQDTYYKLTYNSSFTGNFMMAFPKVWFYRHEDSQYNYIEISNHRLSDDWKCYAHINASGQEVDFIYLPLFKGVIKDSKLRSLPGQILQGGTTATAEVTAATALGSRWQIWDHSSVECINDLLTLMSKSIDSQGRFGKGRESGYNSSDTVTYGKLQTGTLIKGGKFHGFSSSYKEVKVFGIEGFWANRWDRLQGMLLANNVWKIKMTPPYNFTGTDFVTLSNASVPTGNGYLSKIQTSEYGSIPASIDGGSSTKYFKDYFYKTATDTRVALRGGSCYHGASCGFRYVSVDGTPSYSHWNVGASPLYK